MEQASRLVWVLNSLWSNEQRSKNLVKWGGPRETILGATVVVDLCFKPEGFQKMLSNAKNKKNGLIGRMLICNVTEEGVVNRNKVIHSLLQDYIDKAGYDIVNGCQSYIVNNKDPRKIFVFLEVVSEFILDYREKIDKHRQLLGDYENIKDEAARAGEHLERLLITIADIDNTKEITIEHLDCAVEINSWYMQAHLKALDIKVDEEEEYIRRFKNWVYANNLYNKLVTTRDIYRNPFQKCTKMQREELLKKLEEMGMIQNHFDIEMYFDDAKTKMTKRGITIKMEDEPTDDLNF